MAGNRPRASRRAGLGVRLARVFWLAALAAVAVIGWNRWQRGDWPFRSGSRLDGVSILGRQAWGAGPSNGKAAAMARPSRITIHHMGGNVVEGTDRQISCRSIQAIQKEHVQRRHWDDIGYHYIVDRGGRVWEGRPISQQGAHAGSPDANQGNIGVVLLGNFDLQEPSAPQLDSLERLVDALRRRYGIARGQVLSHQEVRSEGGMGATSCPGKRLAPWLDAYRKGGVAADTASRKLPW